MNESVTPATPTPGRTYLHGRTRKIVFGVQWALLILLAFSFLLSLPIRWQEVSHVCTPPACASGQLADGGVNIMARIGIPRTLFFAFVITYDLLAALIGGAIAVLLARQRSEDSIAVLTSLVVFSHAVGSSISMVALSNHPEWGWLGHLNIQFGTTLLFLFFLVFPDGHFQPHWSQYIAIIWVIWGVAGALYPPIGFMQSPQNIGVYGMVAMGVLGLLAQYYRYRYISNHAQRVQTKWVLYGMIIMISGQIASLLVLDLFPWNGPLDSTESLLFFVFMRRPIYHLSIMAFPLFIGVSIWRYRLWNIDLLIYRSLVYGVLTLILVSLFAASFGLISLIFRHYTSGAQTGIAIAISGVAFGLMFQPARQRLKHIVDQRLYGIMIDYNQPAMSGGAIEKGTIGQFNELPGYRALQLVGKGGMAEVYRAESQTSGKTIALKILLPNLSDDSTFRHRFVREAQVVTRLEHPNIVRVYDYGEKNGSCYMVMEYLRGPDLRDMLRAQRRYELHEALPLLRDIAAALDYAHQNGVVHRDIKPSNVVMDGSRAVLTDFGVAKIADASTRLTLTGVLGTFDYISPEQIQAVENVDGRADIYSLGIMTYQLLTGQLPFIRNNPGALILAHVTQPPPDPRDHAPGLSSQAAHAILRSMSKKPNDRFHTAGEFVSALGHEMNDAL